MARTTAAGSECEGWEWEGLLLHKKPTQQFKGKLDWRERGGHSWGVSTCDVETIVEQRWTFSGGKPSWHFVMVSTLLGFLSVAGVLFVCCFINCGWLLLLWMVYCCHTIVHVHTRLHKMAVLVCSHIVMDCWIGLVYNAGLKYTMWVISKSFVSYNHPLEHIICSSWWNTIQVALNSMQRAIWLKTIRLPWEYVAKCRLT